MKIGFLLSLCCCVVFSAANAFTVTFQPAALPGGSKSISSWTEQGLRFATPKGLGSNDISSSSYPYNGTTYADFLSGELPLTITTVDAQPFRLSSVDLAEYSTNFAQPKTITFVGTHLEGTTASATFVTDGIIDGNGPLMDFQTFLFPASFTNLRQVSVNTDIFAMDNVQATLVPEPTSLCLLLLGLLLWVMRRIKLSDAKECCQQS